MPTLTPLTLDIPVEDVLGEEAASKLASVGVATIHDLITYWPRRWRERGEDIDLALIPDGSPATVHAVITKISERNLSNSNRRFLSVMCATSHGRALEVTLFAPWQARKDGIRVGAEVTFSGKVTTFRRKAGPGIRQMKSPEYVLDSDNPESLAGTIVTVYPASAQAPSPWIAEQVRTVLSRLTELIDHVPGAVLWEQSLNSYDWAVRQMHVPDNIENAEAAKRRLTFDEAFAIQLALAIRRFGAKATPTRPLRGVPDGLLEAFDARLPFTLTPGQEAACARIFESMSGTKATNALVEGEVGSGKTVVALRAMLRAVDSGAQCALIAPTEVLAAQHYEGLLESTHDLDINVAFLTATASSAVRREVEQGLRDGNIDIVVGTHVLTTGKVEFDNLGLVVVDEQHRFGVAARDALRAQPIPPHMLVMTATPIPRTLAMTVYGDLDIIELQGLPGGRQPIQTVVIPTVKEKWVLRLWDKIGEEVEAGRQAFLVASLITAADKPTDADGETVDTQWADDSDTGAAPLSVYDVEKLAREHLPNARVGVLHGKLDANSKHEVLSAFAAGDIDVLVATTVIEVGVNVPNATVMAVWDADRFGIAQLHQLRGRVGRGSHPGLCLLVTGTEDGHASRARLDAVASTLDGHDLAMADLKARREGDVLGTGQAGRSGFRLLDLTSGQRVIARARKEAEKIVKDDPGLRSSANRALAAWVREVVGEEGAANLTKS